MAGLIHLVIELVAVIAAKQTHFPRIHAPPLPNAGTYSPARCFMMRRTEVRHLLRGGVDVRRRGQGNCGAFQRHPLSALPLAAGYTTTGAKPVNIHSA